MNSLVGLDIDLELRKFYWYSKVKAKILECKTKVILLLYIHRL
jgi:hypothetical protein